MSTTRTTPARPNFVFAPLPPRPADAAIALEYDAETMAKSDG